MLHWRFALCNQSFILLVEHIPVRKTAASETDHIATCPIFVSHGNGAEALWHCATNLSIMLAQNVPVRKAAASETDHIATCLTFVSHCNVALELTLCNRSFRYACPKHFGSENCRIRNKSNCNLLKMSLCNDALGVDIAPTIFPFCLPETFRSGKLPHPKRINLQHA